MAGITPSQFRLGPDTLADIDALAASNGGQRTTAVKEAAAQFRAAVDAAAAANADEFDREDWERLAGLNDLDPLDGLGDEHTDHGRDWSQWLAAEIIGMWEGRELILPAHKIESKACRKLAARVSKIGRVRGYALMAALRYFWRHPDAGIAACTAAEVWMTPTAKD